MAKKGEIADKSIKAVLEFLQHMNIPVSVNRIREVTGVSYYSVHAILAERRYDSIERIRTSNGSFYRLVDDKKRYRWIDDKRSGRLHTKT